MKELLKETTDRLREAVEFCKEWIDCASRPDLKPSEVPVRIDE